MNKAKLFLENFLVYGVGGVISKVIPLIMVPIITRLMPDSTYFGISDMSSTIISFASAIAMMGMYDAMYRMFFEKEEDNYRRTVCSTTVVFTIAASFVVSIILILLKDFLAVFFLGNVKYNGLIYICAAVTFTSATNAVVAAPTRMMNKRKVFLVTNTISPILSYAISIPLILQGHYLIALPVAALISGLSMEIVFIILNHSWFVPVTLDKKLLISLLKIAVPVMPGFLIYWVFNSSDKVMIANLASVADVGIYSVGAKLGHASQLIYTAFAGGWQYFAFSTMKEDGQVKSNSNIFEYLGAVSFVSTMFICALSYGIYQVLFEGDYQKGYIIAPYLFLAPLLQMLFQVASNQFLVVKKSWPVMPILSAGAVVNVILNFTLIPIIGIEGAGIATLIGYIVADILCCYVLRRMKLMVISGRFYCVAAIMAAFFIVWRFMAHDRVLLGLLMAVLGSGMVICFYRSELEIIVRFLIRHSKQRED